MPDVYEPELYTPDEITPEMLGGMVNETTPRQRRVLDYVERVESETEMITIDVIIEQFDEAAEIAGFSDSSNLVKGKEARSRQINPFHVKNAKPFKATDRNGAVVRSGGGYAISSVGIAQAIAYLEKRRFNLMRIAVLAMCNDRQFVYQDGKKLLTIPYQSEIGKLTTPSTKLGGVGFSMTKFIYALQNEYFLKTGQIANTVWMNSTTGDKFIDDPSLRAAFEAAQSSDPDNSAQLFRSFNYGGINWNILHERYPRRDGTLADPIDDGRLVVTVDEVVGDGPEAGSPIKLLSAPNILNANDAGSPYYDTYSLGEDPWGEAVRLYDNMIPTVMKQDIIMQMDSVY